MTTPLGIVEAGSMQSKGQSKGAMSEMCIRLTSLRVHMRLAVHPERVLKPISGGVTRIC